MFLAVAAFAVDVASVDEELASAAAEVRDTNVDAGWGAVFTFTHL